MTDPRVVSQAFTEAYGNRPRLFRAPGRVNLIGEHTDYNDGFVLPVAIDRDTVVGASPRADRRVRVRSLGRREEHEFDLNTPSEGRRGIWLDYVEGVARELDARCGPLPGADFVVHGDVPEGAGLSSSASLEIAVGRALLAMSGKELPSAELAQTGQAAEHRYVGTLCGIMDQLVAVLGQPGHALLIDCRSLAVRPVPLGLGSSTLLVLDSGVKHELAGSEYNRRRAECAEAVEHLRGVLPAIRSLRDVDPDQLEAYAERLPKVPRRRARHVVSENRRTLDAADALAHGDLVTVGALMAASHRSLRDDYEVSCAELDVLVESASDHPGVRGARMTGGGFGGCTVNLVDADRVDEVVGAAQAAFARRFGREPKALVVNPAAGASEIAS
jgi:galactokinase